MTNNKLALIIDSSATYNKEFYEENNVFCIPLQLIDSNNKSYNDDNIDISQEEMLSQINKGLYFKTSLSNPGEMYNMVEDLCSKFENVVFFPVAYGISGQYNQVVNLIKPDFNNFHVVKNSSCAFATEAAIAKFIEITKTSSIEASISFIEQWIENETGVYVFPEHVTGLIKSGRISSMKGMIANLLKIKPIITLRNSTIDKVDIAKSYTSATEKILNFLKLKFEKIKKPISKIVILITNTTPKEKIEFIKDSITQKFSFIKSKILIRIIPNVFLVHTWDGVFAIQATAE